jgi:hypothetical protein
VVSNWRSRRGHSTSTTRHTGLLPNQSGAANRKRSLPIPSSTRTGSPTAPAYSMSVATLTTEPTSLPAQLALVLGIKPEVSIGILERALYRYSRSKWLPLDVALLLVLFVICFRYPFGAAYFFDISTFGLGAIVAVTTYGLVHSVLRPMTYLRIGLRDSLRSMFIGLVLASAAISALLLLSLLFLALITARFAGTTSGPVIAGGIGLLANCVLVGAATIALSTSVTTNITRLVSLVWLVLALASYSADGLLGVLLFPFRLPLLPFASCYNLGVTGVIGWSGLLALLGQLICIGGIIRLCEAGIRRRLSRDRA